MKPAILIVVCLVLSAAAWGQPQGSLNNDPKNVKFVTSDIANFWRAYDLAAKETERARKVEIFQAEYIDKGSEGLKDFVRLRIKSAGALVDPIAKMPKF